MLWNSNKKVNSEEFDILIKKISVVEAGIQSLTTALDTLKSNVSSLRGLVNRKLADDNEEGEEESAKEGEEEETPLNQMPFQFGK